jgi:hypothetical protein
MRPQEGKSHHKGLSEKLYPPMKIVVSGENKAYGRLDMVR